MADAHLPPSGLIGRVGECDVFSAICRARGAMRSPRRSGCAPYPAGPPPARARGPEAPGLREAAGNPIALLELPRGQKPVAVACGFGLPGEIPLTGRIDQGLVRRLEPLPGETRRLLLLTAAEPVGDAPLLLRAAELFGIGPDAAGPAQADLLELGTRVATGRWPVSWSARLDGRRRARLLRK